MARRPDPVAMARPSDNQLDVVGPYEVAQRLGVQRDTVDQWLQRGTCPAPDWQLHGGPVWLWSTIAGWARRTDRLPSSS